MANSPIKLFGANSQLTAWEPYTPTFSSGFGTVTNINFRWCRSGNTIKVIGQFTSGTMSNDTYSISLPNSLTVSALARAGDLVGLWATTTAGGVGFIPYLGVSPGATGPNFYFQGLATDYQLITTTGPMPLAGSVYLVEFSVPVDG